MLRKYNVIQIKTKANNAPMRQTAQLTKGAVGVLRSANQALLFSSLCRNVPRSEVKVNKHLKCDAFLATVVL